MDGTSPSLELEKYTGKYQNKLYGTVEVNHEDGKLLLLLSNKDIMPLSHYHFDTFETNAQKQWLDEMKVNFHLDAMGKVASLNTAGVDFIRLPE